MGDIEGGLDTLPTTVRLDRDVRGRHHSYLPHQFPAVHLSIQRIYGNRIVVTATAWVRCACSNVR